MIYFDHSSATFIEEEVLESFIKVEKNYFANTESLHTLGLQNLQLQNKAREQIAKLCNVKTDEVIFTSGASEANTYAIRGFALRNQNKGKHILIACGEHSSSVNAAKSLQGFEVEEIPTDHFGQITSEVIQQRLRSDTILVSVSGVQNELGSIRNINAIGMFLKEKNVAFHVDAVQMVGKEPFDFSNVDLVTLSAHKIHGLKGIGALLKKQSIQLEPIIYGGQQENHLRGGTSSLGLQVSFAKALRFALEHQKQYANHVALLNETLRKQLAQIPEIVINSQNNTTNYILNFSVIILPSQVVLNALNNNNIYLSAISTCNSRKKGISSIRCITSDEKRLNGVLRVSFSYRNTVEEVLQFVKVLKAVIVEYGR